MGSDWKNDWDSEEERLDKMSSRPKLPWVVFGNMIETGFKVSILILLVILAGIFACISCVNYPGRKLATLASQVDPI